ncbi:hypothetical protein [Embleya scabrispora]|uniref:hypothetical protein n=1 Tax=Embleya scabrispora TaxID=159449 RepID=UPI001F20CD02|nr:hypothetical protein [Embleya scabrispora]
MTGEAGGSRGRWAHPGKYARIERERRFLLAAPPAPADVTTTWAIGDRYLTGTRLRLRRVERPDGSCEFKLTQKVPVVRPGAIQGLITNTYLSAAEYDLLATLPARVLSKTRFGVPPVGVDVFDGPLRGLVLAEAEFTDWLAEYGIHPATSQRNHASKSSAEGGPWRADRRGPDAKRLSPEQHRRIHHILG